MDSTARDVLHSPNTLVPDALDALHACNRLILSAVDSPSVPAWEELHALQHILTRFSAGEELAVDDLKEAVEGARTSLRAALRDCVRGAPEADDLAFTLIGRLEALHAQL